MVEVAFFDLHRLFSTSLNPQPRTSKPIVSSPLCLIYILSLQPSLDCGIASHRHHSTEFGLTSKTRKRENQRLVSSTSRKPQTKNYLGATDCLNPWPSNPIVPVGVTPHRMRVRCNSTPYQRLLPAEDGQSFLFLWQTGSLDLIQAA